MPGIGTIINVTAIICGGLLGINFGHQLKARVQEILMVACGLDVEKSEFLSENDFVTGIRNRNYYQHEINNLLQAAQESVTYVFCDVNGLHETNNKFGHEAGDRMLIALASELAKSFGQDMSFRFGGDEFVIVMCNTSLQQVERMTDKIGKYMQEENKIAGKKFTVSLAIGYAGMKGSDEISLVTLFDLADKNMYANKRRREERLKDDAK